jgi:hypothetical protein
MGGASSKATAIVDAEINSALSVMQNVVTENSSTVTQINQIVVGPGCVIKGDTLNMGNYAQINMSSMVSAIMKPDFEQDVQAAVSQAADAAAKAGLGIAAADSATITKSITTISAAITQSIRNTLSSTVNQQNLIPCQGGTIEYRVINMVNDMSAITKTVTEATQVTTARQSTIIDIAQEVKSLAEGLDPTMLALIGLAILLVVVGVGFVGAGKAVSILLKPSFWMMVSLLVGLAGTALALIKLGGDGTWPYKVDEPEHNKTVLTIAGIMAGVGFVGTGITGFLVVKTEGNKKKKLAEIAAAAKQA